MQHESAKVQPKSAKVQLKLQKVQKCNKKCKNATRKCKSAIALFGKPNFRHPLGLTPGWAHLGRMVHTFHTLVTFELLFKKVYGQFEI